MHHALRPPPADGPIAAIRRRILLVEDSAGDAALTCERLSEARAPALDVHRAATLAEALSALEADPVDAILLDLNLPDSRGVDTVRRIKIALGDTPLIVISGALDERLRSAAIEEGAEDVFAKEESNSRLFWRSIVQIIERKREQQREFQRVLDATPDAILVVTEAGLTRYVNQAAVDLFGRSRDELLGERLGFSIRDNEPSEIHIPRGDGERICEMRVVGMEWDDEPAHLAAVRDVTERRRAEQLQARSLELEHENRRIHEASRLKSAFLANMSHELRTPLNAIIGFSQMLHDDLVDVQSPQYKAFVGHILAGGRHLLALINDVLDLAKIEAGKIALEPEPVDVQQLVAEVCAGMEPAAGARRVRIELDLDPLLVDVVIDPSRFRQILYNYLSNAVKFSPEGGGVRVRSRVESPDMFRIEVHDRGLGIAGVDLPLLFTRFHQLEAGAAKRHQGTGLGLALTKQLAEAQGGRVGVHSTPGQGSVFFVVLPRRAAQAEAPR